MSKMVTMLYMSKQFRTPGREADCRLGSFVKDLIQTGGRPPLTSTYYFSIFKELAARGHKSNYIIFMHKDWMRSFCGGREVGKVEVGENLNVIYTSNPDNVSDLISKSDITIVRGNYAEWSPIAKHIKKLWIFLPCHGKIEPGNVKVELDKYKTTIFVDDLCIRDRFLRKSYKSEVFKKPANEFYYEPIPKTNRDIDIAFICSKTDRPHKRFDLFLDSLIELDKKLKSNIQVAIVGNSSFHSKRINSMLFEKITIKIFGGEKRAGKKEVRDVLDNSKISVCTSSIDANPRVIMESLTRNVPVLCALDLAGGKFQICKESGLFFKPTPKDLSSKIIYALDNLNKFNPINSSTKIGDAADQLLKVDSR